MKSPSAKKQYESDSLMNLKLWIILRNYYSKYKTFFAWRFLKTKTISLSNLRQDFAQIVALSTETPFATLGWIVNEDGNVKLDKGIYKWQA